jgi:hypothetical protein
MAHYTLIARINASTGKVPFVNTQFSKNHRPSEQQRQRSMQCHLIHPASSKQWNGSSAKHEVVSSDDSCRTR